MSYQECLGYTLREESGEMQPFDGPPFARGPFSFSDHPRDRGGRTMMGITQSEYTAYCLGRWMEDRDVIDITDADLLDIYHLNYWVPVRAGNMPRGVDLALFDFAVNSGVPTAIRKLQKVLGVEADGHIGVKTQFALTEMRPIDVITGLMAERRRYCRSLDNYSSFRGGWERRWTRIEAAAIKMTGKEPTWEPMLLEETAHPAQMQRSRPPSPPQSMAKSDTGNVAAISGSSGLAGIGTSIAKSAGALTAAGKPVTLVALLSAAATNEAFWISLIAFGAGVFIWFERKTKMARDNT